MILSGIADISNPVISCAAVYDAFVQDDDEKKRQSDEDGWDTVKLDPAEWNTVNLQTNQLEQVLSTDLVETVSLDAAMARQKIAEAGAAKRRSGYGATLAMLCVAIVLGAGALLVDSGLWNVGWPMVAKFGLGLAAAAAGVLAIVSFVRTLAGR